MADEVILLDCYISPFAMRARVALAEKGIQYESHEEKDLISAKSELLLQTNPVHKKVPVLIHNGNPVCESMIVVEYIDEVWKGKSPLLPSDPHQRAQARFWVDYIDKKLPQPCRKIWMTTGEKQEASKREIVEALKILEGELGEKPYFGGEQFGFVDVWLISLYSWFHIIEIFGKFRIEELCPKIMAWGRRCLERESVRKSLADPDRIYEFVMAMDLPKLYQHAFGSGQE